MGRLSDGAKRNRPPPHDHEANMTQQRSEIMKRHARNPVLCEYFMQLSGAYRAVAL
jgi:hypothetical protein